MTARKADWTKVLRKVPNSASFISEVSNDHPVRQLELLAESYLNTKKPDSRPLSSAGRDPSRECLHEVLQDRGSKALADDELLYILLLLSSPGIDAKPVADRLLARFGSFANLIVAPPHEVISVTGMRNQSVAALKLVNVAALRLLRSRVIGKHVPSHWDPIMHYLHAVMSREKVEQFRILFLDAKNRLMTDEIQSRGTVNNTPVYPREVVTRANELRASAIILCHNHPSGDPSPSHNDISMTAQIRDAAKLMSIRIYDHVIVGNGTWLSFRKEGLL